MRKLVMLLLTFGLLLFVYACSNITTETINPTEATPRPTEPAVTPVETPQDSTLAGLFIFYKTFLDEKIREPLLNPPLLYDTTDLEPLISKNALLEIYEAFDHQSVTSNFYNAFITNPIYDFDRHFDTCDLTGTYVSCESLFTAHGQIDVEMTARAKGTQLDIDIRLISKFNQYNQVIHRFITFDLIDDIVHIEFAEFITHTIFGDTPSILREIHAHLIEDTQFEFMLKAFYNYGYNDFLYVNTNLKTQTHLLYAYNPYDGHTAFEFYDASNDVKIDLFIHDDDIIQLNILFMDQGVPLLAYERHNTTIELIWNMLEVDGWTEVLCDDCGMFPSGIYLDELYLKNTTQDIFVFYPNQLMPLMLLSTFQTVTPEILSLSQLGLSFTKIDYTHFIDMIDYVEENYVSMMASNGFIFQETVYVEAYGAHLTPYRNIIEAWILSQS